MRKVINIGVVIVIAAALLCVAEYMPELYEMYYEQQYVGNYVLVDKEPQEEGIRYEISVEDKLAILTATGMETFSTEIFSTHSVNELEENDGNLLENLESEITRLIRLRLMPELTHTSLKAYFKEAQYYNVCNKDNPYQLVSVWNLSFKDEERFQYHFLVDAVTYQIYHIDITDESLPIDSFLIDADAANQGELDKYMEAYGMDAIADYWGYPDNFATMKGESLGLYYGADACYLKGESYAYYDFSLLLVYDDGDTDYTEIPYMVYYAPTEKYTKGIAILQLGIPFQIDLGEVTDNMSSVQ